MGRKRKWNHPLSFSQAQRSLVEYLRGRLDSEQPSVGKKFRIHCAGIQTLHGYVEPTKFCVWFKELEDKTEVPEALALLVLCTISRSRLVPKSCSVGIPARILP